MAENDKNVNVNETEKTNDPAPVQAPQKPEVAAEKVKETVPVKLGPLGTLNMNPKVAKALKIVGGAAAATAAVALGFTVGGKVTGKKKDVIIRSKNNEIDRLSADLAEATAPKLVDNLSSSITETVIPDVVDVVAETVD